MLHHVAFHLGLHCLPKYTFGTHLYKKGQVLKLSLQHECKFVDEEIKH